MLEREGKQLGVSSDINPMPALHGMRDADAIINARHQQVRDGSMAFKPSSPKMKLRMCLLTFVLGGQIMTPFVFCLDYAWVEDLGSDRGVCP